MSDKKTDIGTDFEEKLAEITTRNPRARTNNNIYDRFVSRVENTNSEDLTQSENIKLAPKYQSSGKTELELRTDSDNDTHLLNNTLSIDQAETDTVFDFSDQVLSIDTDEFLEIDFDDTHAESNNEIVESESDFSDQVLSIDTDDSLEIDFDDTHVESNNEVVESELDFSDQVLSIDTDDSLEID
ncbi:MAG: hypothetical protein ACTJH0_02170, partial [Psychrobacter sp.]